MLRTRLRFLLAMAALVLFLALVGGTMLADGQTQPSSQRAASNIVACKVLETHTAAQPGVTLILFHQRDKKDQPRFASLLKQADGSTIDIRIGKGEWQTASVARLRMCFGRGLLVFPPGTIKLRDGDEFVARFPAAKASTAQ
jgi:hypothetical protein